MKRLALIAAIAALALSGCGGIKTGPVVSKEYQPASHTFMVIMMPMSCGTNCTTSIPIMFWIDDDEDWVLHLKNDQGKTGEVFVSKAVFDSTNVGDVYDGKAPTKDPTFEKRR